MSTMAYILSDTCTGKDIIDMSLLLETHATGSVMCLALFVVCLSNCLSLHNVNLRINSLVFFEFLHEVK